MDLPSYPELTYIYDDCLESWEWIGSGGFGEIHRAKHTKWRMDVAIKLLRCNDGSDSCTLKEADFMRHGGNPNVLRILGVYKSQRDQLQGEKTGLVMEYMERGSLADLQLAFKGPPPWPLTFRIIYQIALGMNFLHQLKPPLLHLDLKPSNVLLDDSLNAKLTDFGLAKIAKSTSKVTEEKDEDAGGTTSYMPPEAFECSSPYLPAFSSDVYSYGILLWSVITGKQPYNNHPSSLVKFRIPRGDRPDLKSLDTTQTDGLADLIDLMKTCWDPDPKIRPTFMDCIEVTQKVYELYKHHVADAVSSTLKQLDNKDKNSSASTYTSSQTKNVGLKQRTDTSAKPPMQEMGPVPASNRAGIYVSPPANAPPTPVLRQHSSPGNVSICLSNVTGVQIGNDNHMNINIGARQRQRHPTAPPSTRQSSKRQQKPPSNKP